MSRIVIARAIWLASLFMTGATACGATDTRDQEPPRSEAASPVPQRAAQSDVEWRALQALSEHLSVPSSEIEIVSITAIDWPDSSLGCPKPDRSYLQAVRPGHRAILRHGAVTYRVHLANGGAFVCEGKAGKTAPQAAPVPVVMLSQKNLQRLARTDLAHRLGVPVEQVSLTSSRPVLWTDTSLGCPGGGRQSYQSVRTNGYVFDLLHHGRAYTYHADLHRVLPCPPLESQ